MNPFVYLAVAILSEIIATNALKLSQGFTRAVPSVIVVIGYVIAFYFLSLALKDIPLGIAYAIWSAFGTVGTVLIGVVVWKNPITLPAMLGIALIVCGVIILNLFGESAHAA
jgi:small multidrug resistance pump